MTPRTVKIPEDIWKDMCRFIALTYMSDDWYNGEMHERLYKFIEDKLKRQAKREEYAKRIKN